MTAIELKMSLLQEVMSLEDEQLIKKALDSVRRMKMAAFGKATPVEKPADDYAEPTKEEILAGLRNALQDVKDLSGYVFGTLFASVGAQSRMITNNRCFSRVIDNYNTKVYDKAIH